MVTFTSEDFSIGIGLPSVSQAVNIDLKMGSEFLEQNFGEKMRSVIVAKLFELADNDSRIGVDNIIRFYILFVFNCIIFSVSNYVTPRFIFPYLDDLDTFFLNMLGEMLLLDSCVKKL